MEKKRLHRRTDHLAGDQQRSFARRIEEIGCKRRPLPEGPFAVVRSGQGHHVMSRWTSFHETRMALAARVTGRAPVVTIL